MLDFFLLALFLSFCIQILFFGFAATFKTDKVTDLSYGLTFALISAVFWWNSSHTVLHTLVAGMVMVWSARIVSYLFKRILQTKKDDRFDGVRENLGKFATFWLFQALTVPIILLPALLVLQQYPTPNLSLFTAVGFFIWLLGLGIEHFADQQKFNFKKNPVNKNKWVNVGLWKYSRHPNYFGEMLCWWGIFVMAIPFLSDFTWFSMVGPLYITSILLFVSGIPPLEKRYNEKYSHNAEYQQYKKQTSLLIPLPRRIV